MKLSGILKESFLREEDEPRVIQDAFDNYERMENLLESIEHLRTIKQSELSERERKVFSNNLGLIEQELAQLQEDAAVQGDVITEAVQRQFRRYGDKFMRQYRCTTGDKAGRMVSSPEKCGIRKDPRRVRIGKKASRVKKGQRIRKTQFTKRKTQSKRLSRMNKTLRGDD